MSEQRLEELANLFVMQELAPAEEAELEKLIEASPAFRRRFRSLVQVHSLLTGEFYQADTSADIMRDIRSGRVEEITDSVMDRIRPRPARFSRRAWLMIAAAFLILVSAGASMMFLLASEDPLAEAWQGGVAVERQGRALTVRTGTRLQAGDLLTIKGGGFFRFRFSSEETVMELRGAARAALRQSRPAKYLELQNGTLKCTAAPQPAAHPMRIYTTHAMAEVVGTEFTLRAEKLLSRLEVVHGHVRFSSLDNRISLDVKAGQFAEIGPDVESRVMPTNGVYEEFYPNGKLKVRGPLKNSRKHGLWTEWYPDGQKKSEESFRDGLDHGPYASWYPNGKEKYRGHTKDGLRTGRHTGWHVNGQMELQGEVKNGKRHGVWRYWNPDGKLRLELTHVKGVWNGPYAEWYPNGQKMKTGVMKQGEFSGSWMHWREDGSKWFQSEMKAGMKNGAFIQWYPDGRKEAVGAYREDLKTGPWKIRHANGNLKSEGAFIKDKRHGPWTGYRDTGQKAYAGIFVNGLQVGLWKQWYPSGHMHQEGVYEEGQKTDLWKEYTEDGSLYARGTWQNGRRHGSWKLYYPDGSIREEGTFFNGHRNGVWKIYKRDGALQQELNLPQDPAEGPKTDSPAFQKLEDQEIPEDIF